MNELEYPAHLVKFEGDAGMASAVGLLLGKSSHIGLCKKRPASKENEKEEDAHLNANNVTSFCTSVHLTHFHDILSISIKYPAYIYNCKAAGLPTGCPSLPLRRFLWRKPAPPAEDPNDANFEANAPSDEDEEVA